MRYVTPAAPPFLLVHGTADALVRYLHSELLQQALTSAGVEVQLVPIEGADHIFKVTTTSTRSSALR